LLFNFASGYAIRRVQVNQNGFKFIGTHPALVYADDFNILGGSVHTIQKHINDLVSTIKETGLEVNADKTKYTAMSRDRDAARSHNVRKDKSSFERAEQFQYLGTNLINQNSIQEEIKSRFKSGNACYHSVQNLIPSRLLSKNINIAI
jgi:GTP-dependent phosphoenolpyruvate carboxykinase